MKSISRRTTNFCRGCPLEGKHIPYEMKNENPNNRFLVVTETPSPTLGESRRLLSKSASVVFSKAMQGESFQRDEFAYIPQTRCAYDADSYTNKEKKLIQRHCRPYLEDDIKRIRPKVILPLGAGPASQVFGRAVKITKVRGVAEESAEHRCIVMPMLNPAQVAMYPQHEPTFMADAATLGRLVDCDYKISEAGRARSSNYHLVTDLQFLVDKRPTLIAFDTENTSLRWYAPGAAILTMQFCIEPGVAYMLPWDHPTMPRTNRQKARLIKQLKALLCREDVTVVGQNLKYDALFLWAQTGISMRIGGDTLMLAALYDENALTKNLDDLVRRFVPDMAGYADRFNATVDKSRMIEYPLDQDFIDYGCGDADASFRLHDVLVEEIRKDQRLWKHYQHVTLPGLNAFRAIETRGWYVNEEEVEVFEQFMKDKLDASYRSLLRQVPRSIKRKHVEKGLKFSRGDFLRDILFYHPDGFRLSPRVYTKSTAKLGDDKRKVPSVSSKDHLPFFFEQCPFTAELAQYIKDERLLNTNIIGFKNKYIHDGKVRPVFRMDVTVTGRTSCVHADTPVVTKRGTVRADEVTVGDEVWTHAARWRPVTKLFQKAPAQMYGLHLSNGEVLTVTLHHRVMLDSEAWADVGYVLEESGYAISEQAAHEGRTVGEASSGDVSHRAGNGAGGRGSLRGQPRDGASDDPRTYTGRGIRYAEGDEIPKVQVGREEPAVRTPLGLRLRGWEGVFDAAGGRGEVLRASHRDGGVFGPTSVAVARLREYPPHRRESEEQRDQQPCADNASGASGHPRPVPNAGRGLAIEKVVCAGVHRVYDFEVAEDHSYLACGVFNHNSEDPNGQNYPKRGAAAKAYRKLFYAPEGFYFIEADLSQAELRIAANMSRDPTMLRIYREGGDIHLATALIVTGMTEQQFAALPKEERDLARFKAKAVNFGFLYGMGWRKFIIYAKTQYGVEFSEREAQRIRERFFETYYRLPEWHKAMREHAHRYGMVRSYSGRVRHLPMIHSEEEWVRSEAERQAINSPVQEFGSTLGVMALARIEQAMDPDYMQMNSFVHDALYGYVRQEYLEWGAKTIKLYMETNPIEEAFGHKLVVPIEADVSFGLNLGEMYELKGLKVDPPRPATVLGRARRAANSERYDFSKFWNEEKGTGILVPEQLIPPNNGYRTEPMFTIWREVA